MKKIPGMQLVLLLFFPWAILTWSCKKESENQPQATDIWDIDKNGIPKFVETNYIELHNIHRISRFRSSVGHDYSDAFEDCRSMKHYFEPKASVDWSTIKIFAPVAGKVTRLESEWAGAKIEIASDAYPAFRFSIFHVNLTSSLQVGSQVAKGDMLGTHIGAQTMSDIAVIVNDPTKQGRMVSYFDVITDGLFNEYILRGAGNRTNLMISKATRDANLLQCNGDTFVTSDTLNNWVTLN